MTQHEIDRLVARATGEDLHVIRQLGFSLANPLDVHFDPEPYEVPPQLVDWDLLDLERNVALCDQPASALQRVA